MTEKKPEIPEDSGPRNPEVLYDGDCGYCRRWMDRGQRWLKGKVAFRPMQEATREYPDLSLQDLLESVHLVCPDGTVKKGAAAAFCALSHRRGWKWPWWLYRSVPAVAKVSEFAYRFVARHRTLFSRFDVLLYGRVTGPLRYGFVRNLFLSGLAAVYLLAFASFWIQADGLIGSRGILPVSETMNIVSANLDQAGASTVEKMIRFPTVFWITSGDGAVHAVCVAGILLAVIAGMGLFGPLSFFLLWILYLSISTAGQIFLGYQWDILLLETGFLAIFFAPWRLRPSWFRASEPSRIVLFLYRWLLFRLMLGSGLVKIGSGDETWWPSLGAMSVHYETQPIPSWTAWYVHQLPAGIHKCSTAATLALEFLIPIFVFAPRRLRLLAAACFAGLQVVILATGNYTFFNWLTIVLCIPLLDDSILPPAMGQRIRRLEPSGRPDWIRWCLAGTRAGLLTLVLVVSGSLFLGQVSGFLSRFELSLGHRMSGPVAALYQAIAPFRSISTYGLFAVMTTSRPEITIQGSTDGVRWKDYVFKYKPGPRDRKPPFVAPHQPRLDWQMWFASLRSFQNRSTRGWMEPFLLRLLTGSEPVLGLLETNPFPDTPPKYVRAVVSPYRYTNHDERRETGNWWHRDDERPYTPILSLPEKTKDPE